MSRHIPDKGEFSEEEISLIMNGNEYLVEEYYARATETLDLKERMYRDGFIKSPFRDASHVVICRICGCVCHDPECLVAHGVMEHGE